MKYRIFAFATALALPIAGWLFLDRQQPAAGAAEKTASAEKNPAVERARREVKMLDDLYKTTIVFITNTYVDSNKDVAAGEIARDVFAAMREKGWHDARLIDATGHPTNDENVPHEGFEKAAIKKILSGTSYVDDVVVEDGKQYLRAATVVPVVNEKCIACHPGYKVGDVLGAVSYKLLIE